MRLLVTGGAGFIGSHYVRKVLTGAWGGTEPDECGGAGQVHLRRATSRTWHPWSRTRGCASSRATSSTARLVDRLMGEVDVVVHFAAESHVDRSILGAADFVMTNVVGTQTLLDSALHHEHRRSSCTSRPTRSTGRSRRAAGTSTSRCSPTRRTPHPRPPATCWRAPTTAPTGCRCASPGARTTTGPTSSRRRSSRCSSPTSIDGANVPLYGEGANVRDWLHVDDHCRGIHLVLDGGRAGEVYNIGGGTELTNKELTGLLLEATGSDWDRVERVPTGSGHDLRYSVDITKISDELGYQPQVALRAGPGRHGRRGTATTAAGGSPSRPERPCSTETVTRLARRGLREGQAVLVGASRPGSRTSARRGAAASFGDSSGSKARPCRSWSATRCRSRGRAGCTPCSRPGCVAGPSTGRRSRVVVVEGQERVPQSLGEVDRTPVHVVDQHRVPLAEGRRALAQVDDHVERGTADRQVTNLAWLGGSWAKWMPAQRAGRGDRAVGLGEATAGARWPRRSGPRGTTRGTRRGRRRAGRA